MRVLLSLLIATLMITSCAGASDPAPAVAPAPVPSETAVPPEPVVADNAVSEPGPGGYGFDRSDSDGGIANIMEAFAADEATASCIFDAWGDVANVAPEELTPELMTYEVCGTSIFQMITGDPRFTRSDGD